MTIRFKRGDKVNLPVLLEGEPAYTRDTKELHVGSNNGNVVVGKDMKSFDVTTTPVSYFTTLDLPEGSIMQGFYFAQGGKYIFANVADGLTPESFVLYRLNSTGKFLDLMTLTNFGHGTTLGIEDVGSDTYIWTNCGNDDTGTSNVLKRFKYVPNTTYTPTSPEAVTYSNFGSNEPVYISIEDGFAHLCRRFNGSWRVEKRNLADVKAGSNIVLSYVDVPLTYKFLQGFAVDGNKIYWSIGASNGVTYPIKLIVFDYSTGSVLVDMDSNFGQVTDGVFEGNYKEPEGVFVYKDASGAKSLFMGMITGTSVSYRNKLFAFHSPLTNQRFVGLKLQDIPTNQNPAWINLPLLNGALPMWSYPPQYRLVPGNRVEFRGCVQPSASGTVIGNMSYRFKPRKSVRFSLAGDGGTASNRVTIDVGTGDITVALGMNITTCWLEFSYSLDN